MKVLYSTNVLSVLYCKSIHASCFLVLISCLPPLFVGHPLADHIIHRLAEGDSGGFEGESQLSEFESVTCSFGFVSVLQLCSKPGAALFYSENQPTGTNRIIVWHVQGAASIKEFYARNSRWTEGLISAAKAVGWGATEMV